MDIQLYGAEARLVQDTPPSAEVKIPPFGDPGSTAASFVPSAEDTIDHQYIEGPRAVHDTPLFVEV